ncbi:MAG: helicase SNF2, partial [Planctomycetaceae bacterium]|nr:helicase SNF2 [Planctomycetaceae bacterium]
KVMEYTGLERATLREDFARHNLILTTYGTVRRDIAVLKDFQFDYIVLDEAQTIKNPSSQIARSSRLLKCNFRLALSGTPIENNAGDLWSIFEFLNPGMLGRSSAFRTHIADPESQEARGIVSKGLRPFILRRTKKQVAAELPDRLEETIFCDMEDEQRRLYDELRL